MRHPCLEMFRAAGCDTLQRQQPEQRLDWNVLPKKIAASGCQQSPKKCQGGPYCVIVATMMMHVHKTSTSSVRGKVFDAIKGQELKIGISFLCPTISYCLSFAVERSSQHISRRFFGHPAPLSKLTGPMEISLDTPAKQTRWSWVTRLRDAENSKFKCFPLNKLCLPFYFQDDFVFTSIYTRFSSTAILRQNEIPTTVYVEL